MRAKLTRPDRRWAIIPEYQPPVPDTPEIARHPGRVRLQRVNRNGIFRLSALFSAPDDNDAAGSTVVSKIVSNWLLKTMVQQPGYPAMLLIV
jgi:hypothetical protein